jgi:hypothetical protein
MRVHPAQRPSLLAARRAVLALAFSALVAVGVAVAALQGGNTAASAAITVNVNLDETDLWKKVTVGPGLAEASSRQVIRTADGRVYIFAADDTAQKAGTGPGVIRAYRADETGVPSSFGEADGDHRPTGVAPGGVLGGPDVRLDSNGVAHVLYVDKANGALVHQTFSTLTDTWGPATTIATGVDVGTHPFRRGETASALVLDANDTVHVVYTSLGSVLFTSNVAGTWTAPETVSTGTEPIHPQLAAEENGDLQVVWLEQGPAPQIRWAKRTAGVWGTPETVASGVLGNSNLDQGPSIVLDSENQPRVLFLSCCAPSTTYVRVTARTDFGWVADTMPYDLYAHTPQIYGRGDDVYAFLGHDDQIRFGYAYHLSGQPWSEYIPLTSLADGELDGSASARWDPLHETNPDIIDVAFFDEDKNGDHSWLPELYYMAVPPSSAVPDTDLPLPGARLLGEETIFGHTDFNPAGTAEAFQVMASAAGTLTAAHLYVDETSTATSIMLAIYSDAGGHPGSRLDEGSLTGSEIVAGAWNRIPLVGNVQTSPGARYWIALLTPVGGGEIRFRDVGLGIGSSPAETSADTSLTGWPDHWVSGAVYLDGPLSAYGTS